MSPDGVHDDDFPKNVCLKVNNKVSITNNTFPDFIYQLWGILVFPLEAEFLNFKSSLG